MSNAKQWSLRTIVQDMYDRDISTTECRNELNTRLFTTTKPLLVRILNYNNESFGCINIVEIPSDMHSEITENYFNIQQKNGKIKYGSLQYKLFSKRLEHEQDNIIRIIKENGLIPTDGPDNINIYAIIPINKTLHIKHKNSEQSWILDTTNGLLTLLDFNIANISETDLIFEEDLFGL